MFVPSKSWASTITAHAHGSPVSVHVLAGPSLRATPAGVGAGPVVTGSAVAVLLPLPSATTAWSVAVAPYPMSKDPE